MNIEYSADLTMNILDRLFKDSTLPKRIKDQQGKYTAMAYFVLGQLSQGTENYPQSRRFLLQTIKHYPAYTLNRKFIITLVRSILGEDLIQSIKQLPSSS